MTDISSYDPWRIDPDNPCRVVVVHSRRHFEGQILMYEDLHTHEIAVYATPEEAAEVVRRKNGGAS